MDKCWWRVIIPAAPNYGKVCQVEQNARGFICKPFYEEMKDFAENNWR